LKLKRRKIKHTPQKLHQSPKRLPLPGKVAGTRGGEVLKLEREEYLKPRNPRQHSLF
jgi:hypothetical protein